MRAIIGLGYPESGRKEPSMRSLALCAAVFAITSAAFADPQESGLTASGRAAIEKAVLEVNAQMTRAAEDRDIDRLFSFMLANDRGSIIQSGRLVTTREEALVTVKRNFQGVAAIKYRWNRQLVTVISPTTAALVWGRGTGGWDASVPARPPPSRRCGGRGEVGLAPAPRPAPEPRGPPPHPNGAVVGEITVTS